ncbi:MAG: flippase [Actinomycetota bacterium]|nr:flippase [Actinomycetota bacterium]
MPAETVAPEPPSGARRIAANALYRSLADVGSKVASIALYVVMARRLGDTGFGVFTFALAYVTLVTTLANFGQDLILTREVAREPARVHAYFANTLGLCAALALPALAVALAVAFVADFDPTTRAVVALLGVAIVAELLGDVVFATYQAYERLALVPLVLIPQRALTAALGITALALGAGVVTVAAVYLGVAVLAVGWSFALLFGRVVRPRLELRPRGWRDLMRAAVPVGLAGVFTVVLFRVDTAMLAFYESDAVVGDYGAAYRLLEATLFVSWSVGAAVYPVLARLTRTSDPPLAVVFAGSLKLALAVTVPVGVGAGVLAGPLVRLVYGEDFAEAQTALTLLAPAIAVFPVAYLAGFALVAANRQRRQAVIVGLVMLENVVANLLLIPWLSLDGAALSTSISQVLLAAAMLAAYAVAALAIARLSFARRDV